MTDRLKRLKEAEYSLSIDNNIRDESYIPMDFSKIRIGPKKINDATVDINIFKKVNPSLGDKEKVVRAITRGDEEKMREISDFFYRVSGIYNRLCRYMAYLYRYDWFVTPYINGGGGYDGDLSLTSQINDKDRDKTIERYFGVLHLLDNFETKRVLGKIALEVMKNGVYYGYLIAKNNQPALQDLPAKYCRSRYFVNGQPTVEFNMRYFDDTYQDTELRNRILSLLPKDFQKGYRAYRQGKLKGDFQGDTAGWWLLDIRCAKKFNLSGNDFPPFISVIPAIIDLSEAQELDRRKMAQQLSKVLIQKMPFDKNGDPIFSQEETEVLHGNAVKMLNNVIGADVFTTFADVEVATMADTKTTTTTDELAKVERTVFNEAGISQLQFNSEGNIALQSSILNDEASVKDLLLQFQSFLNQLIAPFNNKPKKLFFKAEIMNTTIYNYKELAKEYESQAKLGYSKLLPQIALGQSQSSILANAYLENNLLELFLVFIPPMSSNTMNTEAIQNMRHGGPILPTQSQSGSGSSSSGGNSNSAESSGEGAGRPEKPDTEKSTKTLQNRESMS